MKQSFVFILSLIASLTFISCATMQNLDINKRTRVYEADYLTTLKASVDYLNAEGWQISTIDKDLGIINTEFKSVSGLSAILTGEERYKINFSIQKVSVSQTKIVANMLYEKKSSGTRFRDGEWTQANMTESQAASKYKEYLDGIQSKIVK